MIKAFNLATFDPRTKLMLMVCLSTVAIFRPEPVVLGAMLVLTFIILFAGGVNTGTVLRQIRGIFYMIIALFVIQSLFVRTGEPLVSLAGFTIITTGGLDTAAKICLRIMVLVMSALILLTGKTEDFLPAMVQMKMPYEIAFMVMAAIHFLPILKEEAMDVYYSVQLRGTEIQKASIPNKIKCYGNICLPILVGAINRAKTMSVAMEARGFRAKPNRTFMRKLKLKPKDIVVLILLPVLTILLFAVLNIY